jgi:hypothetical protein
MILFIKRLLFFCSFCLFASLIVGKFIGTFIYRNIYSNECAFLGEEIKTVFIGDSHAMCAFNDSIIPHSFNASRNSESYFQTYNKLNWILNANPQVKLIVLSYSPHNISLEQNKLILYGDRYYPLLDSYSRAIIKDADAYGLVPKGNEIHAILNRLKHILVYSFLEFKWNWGFPLNINTYWDYLHEPSTSGKKLYLHPVFTQRYYSIHSNLDSVTTGTALFRHFGTNTLDCKESRIMADYLEKICNLCKVNHVNLLLVNTPLHKSYSGSIPSFIFDRYSALIDSIEANNPYIDYIDLSNYNFPDSDFGDADHLNFYGSQKFSQFFNSSALNAYK